jgi:hypothetical protein
VANPVDLLKAARTILLIDWPRQEVPRALLRAGLTVFGFSPGGYSSAELTLDPPTNVDSGRVLLPDNPAGSDFLTFRSLAGRPPASTLLLSTGPWRSFLGSGRVRFGRWVRRCCGSNRLLSPLKHGKWQRPWEWSSSRGLILLRRREPSLLGRRWGNKVSKNEMHPGGPTHK